MSDKINADSKGVVTYATTIDVGTFEQIEFLFTFHSDGTGTAKDQQYEEDEVSFTWDPAILEGADEHSEGTEEVLREVAHDLFWEEINRQLEDPVLTEGDYGSEDLFWENGSEEELGRMVRLTLYTFPCLWESSRDEVDVVVHARTEYAVAELDDYCELMEDAEVPDRIKASIKGLIDLCLRWVDPYGWSLEYNDGAYGRESGYSASPNGIEYTVSRPSFHELAEAREALLRIFAGHNLEEEARALLLPEDGE